MIKEAIKTAKTLEEAFRLACDELGKTEDEVAKEILERPKKGFLGIGNIPAKVRVYYEEAESKSQKAVEFLRDVLDNMGVSDYELGVEEAENSISIILKGDKLGAIIGRRGETLDAIQYLVSLAANRVDNKYTRITIDTGNYREKREKTLQSLARKIAINAVKTGRSSTLEPMNPYERRIIHAAVSQIEGATSTSVGDEPNRKVVISAVNPKKPPYNKDRRGGGYRGKRPYQGGKGGRSYNRFEASTEEFDEAPVEEKPVINREMEENSDKPLYSKIEF